MIRKILNKYNQLPEIVKGTIWFSFAVFFQKGLNVLTTPIYTRLMTKAEYGIYSLYISWYNLFNILCTFNITAGIFNSMLINNEDDQNCVISSLIGFQFLLTIITFILYLLYCILLNNIPGLSFELGLLMFLEILFNIPITIWIAKQKFNNNYKKSCFVSIVECVLLTILSLLFVIFSDKKVYAKIIAIIIIYFIFGIVLFRKLIKNNKVLYDKTIYKKFFILGAPLVFHFLSETIFSQSDKLIIDFFFGKEETAVYSLAHQFSWLFTIIITAVNATFVPWMYKRIKAGKFDNISKVLYLFFLCLSLLIILVSLLSPELIWLYGGDNYKNGKYIIPFLSSSIICLFVCQCYINIELYYNKTKIITLATICVAFINIALNFLLISKFSLIGAAISTLLSYLFLSIFHYCFCCKIIKTTEIKLNYLIDSRKMFCSMAFFLIVNCCTYLLLDLLVIRYIFLVIFFIILCICVIINLKNILLVKSRGK